MTPEELDRLEELEKKATNAPWYNHSEPPPGVRFPYQNGGLVSVDSAYRYEELWGGYDGNMCDDDDINLIAALRNAAPSLLRLAREHGRLVEALKDCRAFISGKTLHKSGCECESVACKQRNRIDTLLASLEQKP